MLRGTPFSREVYEDCRRHMDDESIGKVKRAWCFHVVVSQGLIKSDAKFSWLCVYNISTGSRGAWSDERVVALATRLRNVQLECKDGLELMDRVAHMKHAVVYVDPPYETADTSGYVHGDVDTEALTERLREQEGRVAISGYNQEWDHLGWERHEKVVPFRGLVRSDGEVHAAPSPRTEVVWTNYSLVSDADSFQLSSD